MEQWKQVWISELAKCYMDTAIQAVQEKLERENPKPLTLDELESMVDEPIYCVSIDGEEKNQWGILALSMMGTVGIWTDEIYIFLERDYGKTWLAYRYKPDLVNVNKIEHIAQVGEMMEGE
ncbi:hypothetical protein [Anaerotignum sp.]|uniref:hypothetical protein n=1 Tax=Anaerotignum sp. TaxID=2039241 RepID=UPI0027148D81|nr:hypothetical protein [Anaerotignum sp.]